MIVSHEMEAEADGTSRLIESLSARGLLAADRARVLRGAATPPSLRTVFEASELSAHEFADEAFRKARGYNDLEDLYE